jgi:hypothetical protein
MADNGLRGDVPAAQKLVHRNPERSSVDPAWAVHFVTLTDQTPKIMHLTIVRMASK